MIRPGASAPPRQAWPRPAAALAAVLLAASPPSTAAPRVAGATAPIEVIGACDASAAVPTAPGGFDAFVVWHDEDEITYGARLDGSALRVVEPPRSDPLNLRRHLRFEPGSGEADLEGAAWLGDRLFVIGSHGRNTEGARRPRREQLVAVSVSRDAHSIRVEVAEGTRAYRDILRQLARFPSLAPYLGLDVAQREDLNPEVSGINLEGLAAGPDGTSLLLGFRGPLTPEGRAILLRLRNPEALVTTGGDAVFDETPDTLWLNRRGIRSIERVPGAGPPRYFIVAGPVADGPPGFALFAWSGVPGEQPVEVEGSAARFDGDDPFRPEGMIVEEGGRRILLVSDDGRRKVEGMDCRALPADRQIFRMMVLELSDP